MLAHSFENGFENQIIQHQSLFNFSYRNDAKRLQFPAFKTSRLEFIILCSVIFNKLNVSLS